MKGKVLKQLAEEYLDQLSNIIGERPTGSENNRKAVDFIGRIFEKNHFFIEYQSFECIDWKKESVSMQIEGKKIPVEPSPYTLPCTCGAHFLLLDSINVLKESDLQNKIAVLHGELTQEPLMPKNFRFWNPEHHKEIIRILEEKNPLAVVTVLHTDDRFISVIEDGDFNIPNVMVKKRDADILFQNPHKKIHLEISCKRIKSKGDNVIARKNTGQKKKIVICAHSDTKPGTPGALDNASGIVVMLLLSHLLESTPGNTEIECIAFNGEDYFSTPGQVKYLDTYAYDFDRIAIAVNCDGVGLKNHNTAISFYECTEDLTQKIMNKQTDFTGIEVTDPWPQGDHMIFAGAGVPALAVTSSGSFELVDKIIHTAKDTMDLMDIDTLCETAVFIHGMIQDKWK